MQMLCTCSSAGQRTGKPYTIPGFGLGYFRGTLELRYCFGST